MDIKTLGTAPSRKAPADYFTGTVWQELDGRLPVGRERPIQGKVRKDHPRRALAALLAVEDDPQWYSLANSHQVRRVPALHGQCDFLEVPELGCCVCFLGPEEEPAQNSAESKSDYYDGNVGGIHCRILTVP